MENLENPMHDIICEMYGEEVSFFLPYDKNDSAIIGITTDGNVVYDESLLSEDITTSEGNIHPIIMKRVNTPSDGSIVLDPRGLDAAIIGETSDFRVVYDYDLLVQAFMDTEDWSEEEAIDWISYNKYNTCLTLYAKFSYYSL